jgi:guanylate kinase
MAKFFIISGPSGVGKDTIVDGLLERHPDWSRLTTSTTRPRLKGEVKGKYRHLTRDQFQGLIRKGKIFEWAKIHGQFYGSNREDIEKALRSREPIVFDLDIQGAQYYRKKLGDQVRLIFLEPDSWEVLGRRLRKRKRGEGKAEIDRRLSRARKELLAKHKFDHSVVNSEGRPAKAVVEIEKIIDINR